jgi:hypothetical protein
VEPWTKERRPRREDAAQGAGPDPAGQAWARRVLDALAGLRFGSVEVVVHDGRIVQIERREKVRL